MTLHAYLRKAAAAAPSSIALVTGGQQFTYAFLSAASERLACYLAAHGLRRGDRVAVCLDNSVETVISIFGILQAGGCFVLLHHTTPPDRLRFILNHCSPRFLIAPRHKHVLLREALEGADRKPALLLTGEGARANGAPDFDEACRYALPQRLPDVIDLDLASIIYTSGSTGEPKGVTFAHQNIDAAVASIAEYLEHTDDDTILCVLPLSFGYGLLQLLVTFFAGGRLVLEKGFGFPYDVVEILKRERITGFAGVPTLFSVLCSLESLRGEEFPSLRYATNAAAAMPTSFIPRLRVIFPNTKIYLMHGLTECLRTTYLPPDDIDRRPASVGRGMPNVEMWLEDETGNRVTNGAVGELVIRGRNVMLGYWNDPEGTNAVVRPGRFPWERILHTRDLFRCDEDGYFYFVARKDDIIKCRGERISPREIEDVLYAMDEVHEARVIGVPDPLLGQAIRAEIVVKEGSTLAEADVKAFCRQHLEAFKTPGIIAFVTALPKTAGGKIRRVGLAA